MCFSRLRNVTPCTMFNEDTMTPTPAAIWALRSDHLHLSREAFGELFSVKARTVESWEQLGHDDRGRRVPRGMALEKLRRLLQQYKVDTTTQ